MKRTRQERLRLGLLFALICVTFTLVAARLFHLQVVLGPRYAEIVERQSSGVVEIPAQRGNIYDRHGVVVANNIKVQSLFAYPTSKKELNAVCDFLERLYNLPGGKARRRFGLELNRFRWIDRTLDDNMLAQIRDRLPAGLHLREETRRSYPFDRIGKQILGYTDIDHRGCSGLELSFNTELGGQPGKADFQRDALSNVVRIKEVALVEPVEGQSLVLTLDWSMQEIVEKELARGVDAYNAEVGMAVFVDCRTGEILAMAHNDPSEKYPDKPTKLRAIADMFEPGSVLKAFTAAGLLNDRMIDFDDSVYCEMGKWKVGGRTLHDDKEKGWLTFREIIEYSSNIGLAKWAIERGGDELYTTLKDFGFGSRTGIELPSETPGWLNRPKRWSDYTVSAMAIGHSVTVSALQLAVGFAAIANGGTMLKPYVVMGRVSPTGEILERTDATRVRQVISEEASDTLAAILRGVVESGTADLLRKSAVSLAGKTGTAQMVDHVNKRYFHNKFMAGFAAFFPAEDPQIAGVVIYQNPKPIHYGGYTAGPSFMRIAERYAVMRPDQFNGPQQILGDVGEKVENTVVVPDLRGRRVDQALAMAERRGVALLCGADEGIVEWQFPPADHLTFGGEPVLVAVSHGAADSTFPMPDLTGLSIRSASAFCQEKGITIRVRGNGKVYRQSIKPGTNLGRAEICWLECKPNGGDRN